MAIGGLNLGQELLNVPMGDMIRSIALAIADAQWAWTNPAWSSPSS